MRTFEELTRIANTLIKQLSLKVEIITPEMARVYLNTCNMSVTSYTVTFK